MIQYVHQPLTTHPTGFASRLLRLLPGAFADDIHVELEPVFLPSDGSDPPKYEALSYVWGSLLPAEPKILVKDKGESADAQPRCLTVRENLRSALLHLRSESAVRTLWIDAICINQDDEAEKSKQVAHMGSIYELAERVVIWFGPAIDGSAEVIALLNRLAELAQYEFRKDLLSWTTGDSPPKDLEFTENDLESLILGVSNTWFDRVWTLQELGLTNPDTAMIQWGPQTVPFVHLQTAIIVYQSFYVDHSDSCSAALRRRWSARRGNVLIFLMARFYLGFDFGSAMETIRYRDCHDPRDRIYAALRLCTPRLDVVPDYGASCTAAALFERVCLRQLQDGADLLGSCEWPNGMGGFPSWVPNWHAKRVVYANLVGHSAGLLRNQYRQDSPGELICWGKKFADVADVLDLGLSPASSDQDVCAAVEKMLAWVTKDFAMDLSVLTHVAYALFPEGILEFTWPLDVDPANGLVPMTEAFNFLRSYLPGDRENKGEEEAKESLHQQISSLVARCIRERCTGRCLVKTSSGSFGSVLNSAAVGDQLFTLPGCRHSIVLRHSDGNRFRVVGSGFVASNMAGEALLGPLMGMGMREVRLTLEGGYGYIGFFGGKPFRSDARIERLYSTSEAGAHVRPGDQVVIADMYNAISVDVLRKNGVELEEVTLF